MSADEEKVIRSIINVFQDNVNANVDKIHVLVDKLFTRYDLLVEKSIRSEERIRGIESFNVNIKEEIKTDVKQEINSLRKTITGGLISIIIVFIGAMIAFKVGK